MRWMRFGVGVALVASVLVWVGGCEQSESRQSGSQAPPTTQATEEELASVRDMVADAQPPRRAAMPQGHPDIGDMPAMPGAGAAPASAPAELKYAAPESWERQPVTSSMRKDQYLLLRAEGDSADGELTVFYFGPGGGGGVEANIVRWRQQFTTADGAPIPDEAFSRQMMEVNGLRVSFIELTGRVGTGGMHPTGDAGATEGDQRLLAAIVETPDGPWFFKAVGPSATMAEHRAAFVALLESMEVE